MLLQYKFSISYKRKSAFTLGKKQIILDDVTAIIKSVCKYSLKKRKRKKTAADWISATLTVFQPLLHCFPSNLPIFGL